MMGCIARSPSPANEIPANSSNDQSTASSFTSAGGSQNVLQEVQELRVSQLFHWQILTAH